jgi:redox-sensing transcriptional repressor
MASKSAVSLSVIRRLPRYYRYLGVLKKKGITRISSRELSERMGLTASQIRQDLNCFGGFGQQGYGYNVESLQEEIANILGLRNPVPTIQIGVGNLGKAIASHLDFSRSGFEMVGLFDSNPALVGKTVAGFEILPDGELETFCAKHHPQTAFLCVPEKAAKELVKRLVDCGVRSFWNFSSYDLALHYDHVVVENVHLMDNLMTLRYQIQEAGITEESV